MMLRHLIIVFVLTVAAQMYGADRPNIVIIFIDDLGYGDIGPFGNTVNQTPHLDRMAEEGNILKQFYVSNTNCTASRAALLTGTFAHRIGMDGEVCFPGDNWGLNPEEYTLADLMNSAGYATAIFGKWHLGDQPEFFPLNYGFDEFFGIPYSNNMWPGHTSGNRLTGEPYKPLPVIRQNEVVAYVSDGADQSLLCEVITDEAIKFIRKNQNRPFFLYVPHIYVHLPRFARPELAAKAGGDIDRANVEEVDASVGRILVSLEDLNLDERTLVIFLSDNGGARGMSMGPLRGGKGGIKYEGHMRTPTITWWPGTISPGTITEAIATTTDLLPSLAKLVGAEPPTDPIIDGKNALDILLGKPEAESPHEVLFYEDDGIRRGKWKLVEAAEGIDELYNLETDLGETTNLADIHPNLVNELNQILESHAKDIASNTRPNGRVSKPKFIIEEIGQLPRLRHYLGMKDFEAIEKLD